MSESDSTGVPSTGRRFAPLWEEPQAPPTRGRPARVNRTQVIAAAVTLADESGLDGVSMRSVARALGVGTMTLYSHVPSREQLVDAMIDRAYADFTLPDRDLPWRPALDAFARGYWSLLRSHPWLLAVNTWRMPLGPHVLDADEAGYRILADTGLTANQVVETIAIVNQTVSGFARAAAAEDADQRSQGTDYETYWAASSDFWESTFDASRYPTMTRLWTVGAFDDAATPFELRLGSLLDTVELLIARAGHESGAGIPSFDECLPVRWPETESTEQPAPESGPPGDSH